ncbi:MAG: exopolysaccharide biosynthesis protein, partial [Sphingomicrobium sp.]
MATANSAPETRPLNFSDLIAQILAEHPRDKFTLSEFSALLRDRTWGGLLLIFALINVLPLPPGTTTITGIPLIVLTAQMVAGRTVPWFPRRIDERGVTKEQLVRLAAKIVPWERRLEWVFKPRLVGLTRRRATRVIGAICLLLSILLWLPIPLGNHAPAITMTAFALGLIYRDGLLVIVGAIGTVVSIALVSVTLAAFWLAL